jgi:hypothetical protein
MNLWLKRVKKKYVINGKEDSCFWPLYGVYNLSNIICFDEEKILLKSLMILHAIAAFFNKMVRFVALSNDDSFYYFLKDKVGKSKCI